MDRVPAQPGPGYPSPPRRAAPRVSSSWAGPSTQCWLVGSTWIGNLCDAGSGGITGPFWFAFVASAVILALIWRELAHMAHASGQLVLELDGPIAPLALRDPARPGDVSMLMPIRLP